MLARDEVEAVPDQLDGVPCLVCTLLGGSGPRLLEGLQLRVKGRDFGPDEIALRDGKGPNDQATMLPDVLVRNYPNAHREWGWQCFFPASSHHVD